MPRTFSASITKKELMTKILALISQDEVLKEQLDDFTAYKISPTALVDIAPVWLPFVVTALKEDLKKVEFDTENCEDHPKYGFNVAKKDSSKIYGLHTLPNGLTFLGCAAGGDWEIPIFFIIYWNGKKLRAYIPDEGQYWNRKFKRAYKNVYSYDEDDEADSLKQHKLDFEDFLSTKLSKFDVKKLLAKIEKEIAKV